jgi:hypothetical protein
MLARCLGMVGLMAAFPCWGFADDTSVPKQKEPVTRDNKVEIRQVGKDKFEITVTSERPFPVVNAIAVLSIGAERSLVSRNPPDGSTKTLIFAMSAESFAKTRDGDAIRVCYDPDSQGVWEFGKLDKSKVKR